MAHSHLMSTQPDHHRHFISTSTSISFKPGHVSLIMCPGNLIVLQPDMSLLMPALLPKEETLKCKRAQLAKLLHTQTNYLQKAYHNKEIHTHLNGCC